MSKYIYIIHVYNQYYYDGFVQMQVYRLAHIYLKSAIYQQNNTCIHTCIYIHIYVHVHVMYTSCLCGYTIDSKILRQQLG